MRDYCNFKAVVEQGVESSTQRIRSRREYYRASSLPSRNKKTHQSIATVQSFIKSKPWGNNALEL
jgi:hypothetical protein